MYNHPYMDPEKDAKSLQRKVQFDFRFYFAQWGAENMEKMKKNTFTMQFDTKSETWYVIKNVDVLTKNYKDISEKVSGFMPENKDDKLCPVKSFQKYNSHLHPQNDFLWQKALDKIDLTSPDLGTQDSIWEKTLWLSLWMT